MAESKWGDYSWAYKAIHDKIAEVLAKLDAPADPQTVDIITSIALTVIQQAKDRTITALPEKGSVTRINLTASTQIIAAPSANNHLQLFGFVISVDGDEICRLRWGGATGDIIAVLPTKGIIAMNLINLLERGGGGGTPENLYLEKTGSGNCQGTVWTETVAD